MWKFNDKGLPQEFGSVVMDSLRMIVHGFRAQATPLTPIEKFENKMEERGLSRDKIQEIDDEADRIAQMQVRLVEERAFAKKQAEKKQGGLYRRVGVVRR